MFIITHRFKSHDIISSRFSIQHIRTFPDRPSKSDDLFEPTQGSKILEWMRGAMTCPGAPKYNDHLIARNHSHRSCGTVLSLCSLRNYLQLCNWPHFSHTETLFPLEKKIVSREVPKSKHFNILFNPWTGIMDWAWKSEHAAKDRCLSQKFWEIRIELEKKAAERFSKFCRTYSHTISKVASTFRLLSTWMIAFKILSMFQ